MKGERTFVKDDKVKNHKQPVTFLYFSSKKEMQTFDFVSGKASAEPKLVESCYA